ncbi:MAG TPA: EAL domain-containing protein [Thermoanaerobaculia bacterium]|nr:EAL domain-containing protein [Thermoanaerobaculia bacterium]
MSGKSINRLLLVEDDPGDAVLLRSMFNEQRSPGTELIHVGHMSAAETYLSEHAADVILLDLGLPDAQGLETVRRIRAAAPRTPLVVLTGLEDDSLAVEALQEGAQDYLVKGQIEPHGVLRALRHAIERKSVEEALVQEKQHAQIMLDCIGEAVVCTDISGNITFLNLVAKNMSGWSWQEAAGRPMAETLRIVDATSRETIANPMALATASRSVHLPSNCILIRHDGVEIPIEDSGSSIYHREGQPAGAVIVFHDVSAVRAMSLELTYSAQHDFLTGLPNRLLLNDRIHQAIALAPRHNKHVALLFMDLDGFKHINDSLGHPIGDKLLQCIARRLVDCVRASDTVSRQGGDEFVVLLSEADHWEDIATTARRMLHAVAEVHSVDQHDLHITTSIGVSVFPDDGLDAETLIRNADTAMYQAKENGRQSCQFFKPEMNARAVERQSIEESLRRALERKEFVLHYQPKVNLKTGAITGAEALIRWTHPVRGSVPPVQFVPVAEDCGLILPIGNWALREACRQARAWVDAGLPLTTIAVNVSSMQLQHGDFLAGLFAILDETGLDPRFLELELTESVLMEHSESAASILQTLREKGVQVAVDDFGTGYSSLSYLRKFPVDALKIDQSFVSHISTAGDNASIVTAVISMARSLKLRVVAEGVETLEELVFLQTHECDEGQGFYFSQPVPPEQFAALLERGLLETVAAEDLERRIAGLQRELAERDRQSKKVELENARLRQIVKTLEGANRVPPNPKMRAPGRKRSKLQVRQQD